MEDEKKRKVLKGGGEKNTKKVGLFVGLLLLSLLSVLLFLYSRPSKLFHKSSFASAPSCHLCRPHPNGPATFFYSLHILVCRSFFQSGMYSQKVMKEFIFGLNAFLFATNVGSNPTS